MLNQKFILYSMFLIILSGSQIYPQVPYFLWDKFIENESKSYMGHDLECTPNNEYLITGSTLDGTFDFDLIIIKTDHNGNLIWEKEFGETGLESGEAITVIDSNNYIVLGQIESYTSNVKNIWILKIDENGDTVYTKTIENGIPSEIKTIENNEYIIVGKTINQEEVNSDVLLIKLDTNCDTIWTKTYGSTNNEEGISVVQTDDLGYLILGLETTEIFYPSIIWFIKTDANGDTLWTKTLGTEAIETPTSMVKTVDGSIFIIARYWEYEAAPAFPIFIKLDADYNVNMYETIYSQKYHSPNDIISISDSLFIITGTKENPDLGRYEIWIEEINLDGDSLWADYYSGMDSYYGNFVTSTKDTGFVVCGEESGGSHNRIALIKYSTQPVKADFSVDPKSGRLPLSVNFKDSSSGLVSYWSWDFENDGIIDSYEQNPSWTYFDADTYSVRLIVSNDIQSDTLLREKYITAYFDSIPNLYAIEDIPNDQGGWVKVNFTRSFYDTDTLVLAKALSPELYTVEIDNGSGWTAAASSVAYGKSIYSILIHTTKDSTAEDDGLINFRVIAGMEEGNFVSDIFQGYSVDNLIPSTPQNLVGRVTNDKAIHLSWVLVRDEDFKYYQIYRSEDGLIFEKYDTTIDTFYIDDEVLIDNSYHYAISSVDHSGNESVRTNTINFEITDIASEQNIPSNFYLLQNYPNPFNPQTTIKYGLKQQCFVNLEIYNVLGQKILDLINEEKVAGHHQIIWDGKNQLGQDVSTGIYYYRIKADNYIAFNKMILIR